MKEFNAKIESTMLGIEDHGIMTFFINLTMDRSGQSFGGYCLKGDKSIEAVRKVLETVGVDKWEDLKGKYIRIRKIDEYSTIEAIGHIVEDRWWSAKEHWGE